MCSRCARRSRSEMVIPGLQVLEKKVAELEKTMRKDSKRFQRMLMMLAMSDDGDEEILEALKGQDKADKI